MPPKLLPQRQLRQANSADQARLLTIWEAAVRATHAFLDPADIDHYRQFVPAALGLLNVCLLEEEGQIAGFVGWRGERIEMLFIAPEYHRQGVGRQLLAHVFATEPASAVWSVEVHEDNPAACQFYLSCGFEQTHRSALDHSGRPYPLLYLRRGEQPCGANAPCDL